MGKGRQVSDAETLQAMSDAVTRALHWAPETLLIRCSAKDTRDAACRRLAIRVVTELGGDGWTEGRCAAESEGLHAAIATGMAGAGDGILSILPEARRANGRLLDGVGLHIGGVVVKAMHADGARLRPMTRRARMAPIRIHG